MVQSTNKITASLGWSFSESIFSRGLSFFVQLYLARLLLPEAFGLIGMAVIFIAFVNIMAEMGLTAALVQRKAESLRQEHWNTAFTLTLIGAFAGWLIICVVLAPFAASFYGEPVLRRLLPILAIGLILNAFSMTQKARLQREMKFKTLSIISICATVISSSVAIALAYAGLGVWALVAKALLNHGICTILFWSLNPRRMAISITRPAFQNLFGFSIYVLMERVLQFLLGNIDFLLVGKLLGSTALGLYTLAFLLTNTFRQHIMQSFNKVLFPVYSHCQEDPGNSASYFLEVVKYSSLVINPIMLMMFLNAPSIIQHFFGDPWIGTIGSLRILCISVMIHAFGGTAATLIQGTGHPKTVFALSFISIVCFAVPCISFGALYFGIIGASIGVLIHHSVGRALTLFWVYRLFPISLSETARAVLPSVAICVVIGALNMLFISLVHESLILLIIRLAIELIVFAILAVGLDTRLRSCITGSFPTLARNKATADNSVN